MDKVTTDIKTLNPFKLGEQFARDGRLLNNNPFIMPEQKESYNQFKEGYNAFKRRTMGSLIVQPLP
tara:strand:+ start:130 stop:327 length:198 start_codon:yes stop_codon:yes gene_type:complete